MELPKARQQEYLRTACPDADLVAEVLAMLEEDEPDDSLLDGMARAAREIFAQPPPVLAMPGQFGPYRLGKLLGEGGMGVVYLATRDDIGSQAAIKILREAWLSPVRRDRFLAEQKTLAQLNHPAIARIYDADTSADGTPWFAMEYVDGAPLTTYVAEPKFSIDGRLRLFRSVCEAVQFAHGHAVIHRDLKPSNILVTAAGDVKLLDFGIAKQLGSSGQPPVETRTGLRLMTPAYAAPEQIRGEQVGIHTDVYALGVILYELLTDRLPFDLSALSLGEAERLILEREPERPSVMAGSAGSRGARRADLGKAAWADLDVLCLTAMRKDPQRRYRSVDALIRDVDHYLSGRPLDARPDKLGYRLGKFVRRNRRAVSATSAAGLAFAVMGVYFTARLETARNTAVAAVARMQRVQQFMLNLFEGGDKQSGPAAGLRVSTIIDRGVKQAQSLRAEPEVQAELYLTLGSLYEKMGNLAQADTLLQSSLDRRRSLLGSDHLETGQSLVALGLLRAEQARLDEAETLVRRGLETIERARPRDAGATAEATAALGKVLTSRGSYAKAVPLLEQAVALQSRGAPTLDLAGTLKDLSDTQFYAGHYDACEALTRRALAIHRDFVGDRHPLVADDLINLGAVQFQRGRYGDAERLYRQALAINEPWYGEDNPETASTLSMLGRAIVFQGRYDEGLALSERALAIQEHVYGPNSPRVANVLNELGTVALQRNQFDDAEARFRRMAEIYKSAYGEHHYLYALALANVASVYLAEKQYARAEPMFRDAVRRYSEALSPEDMNTAIAQVKLGRTLVGEKRYAEAEGHTMAGYKILIKQTSPTVSWIQTALKDLTVIYEALGQPEKASEFRVLEGAKAKEPAGGGK
ncbi:MAG TPA: serine/threonine-protein kinase [Bryobacteraceae bacterium]